MDYVKVGLPFTNRGRKRDGIYVTFLLFPF